MNVRPAICSRPEDHDCVTESSSRARRTTLVAKEIAPANAIPDLETVWARQLGAKRLSELNKLLLELNELA
jgi:hypothetical protein